MILGTLQHHRAQLPSARAPLVGVRGPPSPEALVADFAAGGCDWVVVAEDATKGPLGDDLYAVCSAQTLAAAWTVDRDNDLKLLCAGRSVGAVYCDMKPALRALRACWLDVLAREIDARLRPWRMTGGVPAILPRTLFRLAVVADSTSELPQLLDVPPRHLRESLRQLDVRGPKRFLMVARLFRAWELSRLRPERMERVAHSLGWSSLSTMDRTARTVLEIPPQALRHMSLDALLDRLVRALRTPKSDQEGQIQGKIG